MAGGPEGAASPAEEKGGPEEQLRGKNLLVQKTSLSTIFAHSTHSSYLENIEDGTERTGLDISGNIKMGETALCHGGRKWRNGGGTGNWWKLGGYIPFGASCLCLNMTFTGLVT